MNILNYRYGARLCKTMLLVVLTAFHGVTWPLASRNFEYIYIYKIVSEFDIVRMSSYAYNFTRDAHIQLLHLYITFISQYIKYTLVFNGCNIGAFKLEKGRIGCQIFQRREWNTRVKCIINTVDEL